MNRASAVLKIGVVLALFGALFAACADTPTEPEAVPMYPLFKGMTWNYQIRMRFENFRPIHPESLFTDREIHYTEQVRIADTVRLRDSLLTWKFVATTRDSAGIVRTSEHYYRVSGNVLEEVAYRSTAYCYPKHNPGRMYRHGGKTFASVQDVISFAGHSTPVAAPSDSTGILFNTPPLRVLEYPLVPGKRWIFASNYVRVAKEVVSVSTVETPAGIFRAALIRWLYNYRPDATYDTSFVVIDADALQGLVGRAYVLKDLVLASPSNPEGYGVVDLFDDRILISRGFQ